jgi:membrane protease subunit HflC
MNWLGGVAIVVIVIILVAYNSLFVVNQTEQALVVQLGNPVREIKTPGLAYKVPFLQNVIFFDKRILELEGESGEVITADRKNIVVDAFLMFRISDALRFYQAVKEERIARLRLAPILNSSLRRVLGGQEFDALLSGERSDVMHQIRDEVAREAKELGIAIVDVRIRRSDLPTENQNAVFERMRTERQRLAAGFRATGDQQAQVIKSEADREATRLRSEAQKEADIIRGQGDAERNRILGDAYGRDPEFFQFYRSLKAYEESMSGQNTTMVITPDSSFFKYFQRGQGAGGARQ